MLSYISLILAYFMLFISFSFDTFFKNFFDREIYKIEGAVLIKGKVAPSFLTKKGIELVEFRTPEVIYKNSSDEIKNLIQEMGGEIPFVSCAVIKVKNIGILEELKKNEKVIEVIYPYKLREKLLNYKNSISKYTFYLPFVSSLIFLLFFLFDKKTSKGERRWIKISICFIAGFLLFLGLILYLDSFFLFNLKVSLGIFAFPYLLEAILKR